MERKPSAARSPLGRPEHRRPHLILRGPHIAWLIKVGPNILTPTWDNSEVIPTSELPRGLTKASVQTALLCNFSLFPSLLPILHFPSTGIDPKSTQPVNLLSEETGSSAVSQERSFVIAARFIGGKVTNASTFSERQQEQQAVRQWLCGLRKGSYRGKRRDLCHCSLLSWLQVS